MGYLGRSLSRTSGQGSSKLLTCVFLPNPNCKASLWAPEALVCGHQWEMEAAWRSKSRSLISDTGASRCP